MPRTFKATLALIGVLIVVALLAIISIAQSYQANKKIIEVNRSLGDLNRTIERILSQLESGVAVAGNAGGGAGASNDRYAAAINDPDNLLSPATDQLIAPDAVQGGTLKRLISSDPKGFNWLTENSVDVREIQSYVHSGFVRQDFNNPDSFVSDLAYMVKVNEENTEYTVSLREGVYWHVPKVDFSNPEFEWLREPRELTAEDATFYFEMAMNPQVEAGFIKSYVEDIEKVEVLDRYTFKVTWKRPVYHSRTTTLLAYPLPKWLFSRDREGNELPAESIPVEFNTHWSADYPIGTGPYIFDSYTPSGQVVLTKNREYFGAQPPIERIEFHIIKDPEQGFARLLSGQLDFLPKLPEPRYRSEVMNAGPNSPFKNGKLEHEIIDAFAYYYVGWNMDKPMFADQKVRLAMTHAFNRQSIIDNVLNGLGELQTGPFYYDHPANDPTIEPIPFDLEKAAALLDEAGWVDTDGDGIRQKTVNGENINFSFTLTSYNRPTVRSWVTVYREDLRKIGVEMRGDFVEWPLMQRRMDDKQFDAFTGGWGLTWFNDPFQIWHSSQADIPKGSNRVGFRNAEADEIIETLRVTFDNEERTRLLRRFHQIVHEEQPYSFFYAPKEAVAWNPRLENVVFQKIRPQTYSLPWYIDDSGE